MPDRELLEKYLQEKQEEFRDKADSGDLDALYEINLDIQDALLVLADA